MTDDNGNLRDVAGLIGMGFEYTSENQLLSVKGDAEAGYVYDCFGHRREDTVSGDTLELYWHDGNYLGERNAYVSAGVLSKLFATTNGQITGFVEGDLGPLGAYLSGDYLLDFLGSVTGEVDALAALSGVRRFKPSGEKYSGALVFRGPGFTGASGSRHTMVPFAEQYNEQRVLSTRLMQWTTRDPIWPRELPYGYVNGNPTTWIDPSGLYSVNFHPDCGKDKRERIEGALFGLCGALRRNLDGCLSNRGCNRGGTMAEAFAALCDGTLQPPITVQCPHWSDPVCYTWGRGVLCAKTFGKGYIVLCQGAFDNGRCPALTCLLMHELFHAFGVAAHTADVFKCLASQYGCQDAGS